jgi:hypothetical protein
MDSGTDSAISCTYSAASLADLRWFSECLANSLRLLSKHRSALRNYYGKKTSGELMKAFLFQTRSDRYQTEMKPGDLVYLWMSGDEHFKGLYGWGEISSVPYRRPDWDSHGVDIQYRIRFSKPIKATSLERDPILAQMLVFRAPHASNFLLDEKTAKRLSRIIAERHEQVPVISGDYNGQ